MDAPSWLTQVQQELGADLIQTHISWVLLGDGVAYKIKKPLKLDFLDYSTIQLRRHYCAEEVRLNARYAPQLYLGVAELGPEREPAVLMRRFDEADRADHRCVRGDFTAQHVHDLVTQVIRLHENAQAAPAGGRLGSSELIQRQVRTALHDVTRTAVAGEGLLAELGSALQDRATALAGSFTTRQYEHRIREGHGDLHLANVVVRNGTVTMFDGIEFSEELRWLDIANELAFTYADLLDHRRPRLAAAMVMHWLDESGDFEGLRLLRFYASYRATVRALAAGMQGDVAAAQAYVDQALNLSRPQQTPRLLITHGLSGSGKSTASREVMLSDPEAAMVWVRSDIERKRLFGLSPQEPSQSSLGEGIYSHEATLRTYQRLADVTRIALQSGWSVVVDATFPARRQREAFVSLAAECGADFGILACSAPESELRARVLSRRGDASEADLEVLERQLATFRPLADDERSYCVQLPLPNGADPGDIAKPPGH